MAVAIRYMGAKHDLAPKVVKIVNQLPKGPCLDAFAGMCSVAGELASTGRSAWCNDVQAYAAVVARALVATRASPPDPAEVDRRIAAAFLRNRSSLISRFEGDLHAEARVIKRGYRLRYAALASEWRHAGNDDALAREVAGLQSKPTVFPYRLSTLTYAYGYFGVAQAIELDSLRYAIAQARAAGDLDVDQERWSIVALLQTASRVASTTGHFAEYLRPHTQSVFERIRLMRQRDVAAQFRVELSRIRPYGEADWRAKNRVYNADAVSTLGALDEHETPRVVYADPPYSRAQYSRYYHVLETLALYDYPPVNGVGRYRDGRYQTPFSHAASVEGAFADLVGSVADLGAPFVLSYPTNGLLYERGLSPAAVMRERFRRVRIGGHTAIAHSTLGGASGAASLDVREMIFVGEKPR